MTKLSFRQVALTEFMKANEIQTLTTVDDAAQGDFCRGGCDVCSPGLGNNVYECHGYSEEHKAIREGFMVCHECLCVEANGYDSDYERELDDASFKANQG